MRAVTLSSAAAFLVAAALAGVFNYAFQVLAAARLATAQYGAFALWFGSLSGFLLAAGLAQNASALSAVGPARLRALGVGVAAGCLACAAAAVLTDAPWLVGALTVGAAVLQGLLGGQLQARAAFGVLAVASVVQGAVRVATPWVVPGLGGFEAAVCTGVAAATGVLALWCLAAAPSALAAPPRAVPAGLAARGLGAGLLAVGPALFPNLDILSSAAVLGEGAAADVGRCTLAGKLLFFAGVPVLNVLLPGHLGAPSLLHLRLERLLLLGCALAVPALWLVFPPLAGAVLDLRLEGLETALLLCSANAALLLAVQWSVQRLVAHARWVAAACVLAVVGLATGGLLAAHLAQLPAHLLGALAGNATAAALGGLLVRAAGTPRPALGPEEQA